MTFRDILGVVLRRWYVLVLIFAATGYLAYTHDRASGSYVSDTVARFTLPGRSPLLPYSGTNDSSVISFANAVADEIEADVPATPQYADASAPFYGAGLRQGVSVAVPNDGGQYVVSYGSAEIEIKIVGQSYEWVRRNQLSVINKINAATSNQQATTGSADRIDVAIEPLSTTIIHVMPTRSSRLVALAAVGAAALLAASTISIMIDDLLRFVGRRRSAGRAHTLRTTLTSGAAS